MICKDDSRELRMWLKSPHQNPSGFTEQRLIYRSCKAHCGSRQLSRITFFQCGYLVLIAFPFQWGTPWVFSGERGRGKERGTGAIQVPPLLISDLEY